MSATLPDRYHLEVRLGRDEDVEEWLATDTVLDRPVLIRMLGPETAATRRGGFVAAAQALAAVNHVHLGQVFAAAETDDGAYLVGDWIGGVSVADRVAAGQPMPLEEFLPNAAGLAAALAAVHEARALHGAVDAAAIAFASAHPAKLGGFGRAPRYDDPASEVAALASALTVAATGNPDVRLKPSQVVEGLDVSVDRALEAARRGDLDAAGLSAALRAAPTALPAVDEVRPWSWRWLVPAAILLLLAVGVGALARLSDDEAAPPFELPTTAPVETVATTTTVVATTAPPAELVDVEPLEVRVYDPFGDQQERDAELPNLSDGDPSTAWRTERYFAQVNRVKQGVGVTFTVAAPPAAVEVAASPGTAYRVLWAPDLPDEFGGWEPLADGLAVTDQPLRHSLPDRSGGVWLLWLTELTSQDEGQYFYSFVAEVRFLR